MKMVVQIAEAEMWSWQREGGDAEGCLAEQQTRQNKNVANLALAAQIKRRARQKRPPRS